MSFLTKITPEWITAITTVIGFIITVLTLKNLIKKQRADFFKEAYTFFHLDKDLHQIFLMIEYGSFKYGNDFHKSEVEVKIDHLLSRVNMICVLYDNKFLTSKEMDAFRYRFFRIYNNLEIQKYLNFLSSFSKNATGKESCYSSFVNYGRRNLKI